VELCVDDIILRHGLTLDLGGNTPSGLMRQMMRAPEPGFDPTDRPLWPMSAYGEPR
jgi:hypothetical protein